MKFFVCFTLNWFGIALTDIKQPLQLAAKLEALRDEYMRFAVEKSSSVLKEYHSAVETITGFFPFC